MTALIQERMRSFERWTYHRFTLASGKHAWKHGLIGINLSTGKVEPPSGGAALFIIGVADETVDAAGADKPINVNLCTEIEVEWWENSGAITAAAVGNLAYALDDQTVTLTPNSCAVGRIMAVEALRGVAVQKLQGLPEPPPPVARTAPSRAARAQAE